MNKTEVNAKLQYVFEGLPLSRVQKEMLSDVVMSIVEAAIAGVTEPEINEATTENLGLVKQATAIADVDGAGELSDIITQFNLLLANLRTAGIISNS